MDEDFTWYLENYDELCEKYGGSYIAIKDKKVLGTYSSYSEAVRTTEQSVKLGSFIVQKCGPDETAYTNYIASMNFVPGSEVICSYE